MTLNLINYKIAMRLAEADLPFSALVAAAMVRADSGHMASLRGAFPLLAQELHERYDAPGGITDVDRQSAEVPLETLLERANDIARDYLRRIGK